MHVLVVGGAGYIGSHMVKRLGAAGITSTVLDNLSSGHRDAVTCGELVIGNIEDRELLDQLFTANSFSGVMHFAANSEVAESVANPSKYYANNVHGAQVLLDSMRRHAVNNFIFSSTAAIFGEPVAATINENHPKHPINPYGRSKWMVEQILQDYAAAYGIKFVCLRYFNAAGADPDGEIGERHEPESHLIPLVLQVASGRRQSITIFGSDYDTPDGTCVRDYVHVCDLCDAHLLAIQSLWNGADSSAFNLGNGNGFSVKEVIDAVSHVSGKRIVVVNGDRRIGDPARLVADSTRAKTTLQWKPNFVSLESIARHAWHWEKRTSCH